MARNHVAQLLPNKEQAHIIVKALRDYSNKVEAEGNVDEAFKADEIRLELLTKMHRNE